jgi:hypothetical protein
MERTGCHAAENSLSKVMVQEAIAQRNTVSKTAEVFRAEMNRLARKLPEYDVVMHLYGEGDSLGPQFMAEAQTSPVRFGGGVLLIFLCPFFLICC